MTKKDGDRLRAMQAELDVMLDGYGWNDGELCASLVRVRNAIEYTLQGKRFLVHRVVPLEEARQNATPVTKSDDLFPAA